MHAHMGRSLDHEEIVRVLDVYANTGEFVIPADTMQDQRDKLHTLTSIIPKEVLEQMTFLFAVFDDMYNPTDHLTDGDLQKEKDGLANLLRKTNRLREYGNIPNSEQDMLALLAVGALESLSKY